MYHFSNKGKTCFPLKRDHRRKEKKTKKKKDSYKVKVSSNQSNKTVQDKTAFALYLCMPSKTIFLFFEFQTLLLKPKLVIVKS